MPYDDRFATSAIHSVLMNWRDIPEDDYFLFARSYHVAAKKLARALELEPGPIPEFDLCPVLSAYRRAVELHLKLIVLGDGGNFLAARPDELAIHKTKSLSWLGQFVTQIVTALRWEEEFNTEGSTALRASRPSWRRRMQLIRPSRRSVVLLIPSSQQC